MSRVIEQERIDRGDLDEDEIIYLAQRDRLPAAAAEKAEVVLKARKLLATAPPPLNEVPNTGTVNTLRLTKEDLLALGVEVLEDPANPPEQFQDARLGDRAPGSPVPTEGTATPLPQEAEVEESDDEEEDYDQWSVRRLRAEIVNRNEGRDAEDAMSLSGNKDELVARLREDDEE